MVRLDVSPDVVFTATPSLFNLDGKVDVPWARIVVVAVNTTSGDTSRRTIGGTVIRTRLPFAAICARQLFNLDGKVDVPWARIVVNEVPESAVGVSSDEVMPPH
jgi:autotransporter translocation and assembly factor TamB